MPIRIGKSAACACLAPLHADAARGSAVPPLPIARGRGPMAARPRQAGATSTPPVHGGSTSSATPIARINAALKDQLDRLPHVMLAGCTHAPAVELAERLSALTGGVLGHCFFASDGASAVEIALKMSFHSLAQPSAAQASASSSACGRATTARRSGALAVTDVAVFRDAYDPAADARAPGDVAGCAPGATRRISRGRRRAGCGRTAGAARSAP